MSRMVDAVDMSDPLLSREVIEDLARHAQHDAILIRIPPSCEPLDYVASQLLERTAERDVKTLRIWGRGSALLDRVAAGREAAAESPVLMALRSRFQSAKSRIELRGCDVPEGAAGIQALRALAQALGVRVVGGVGSREGMDWLRAAYQAEPDGSCTQIRFTASALATENK